MGPTRTPGRGRCADAPDTLRSMAETSPNDASPASTVESGPPCRLCGAPLTTTFVDLGRVAAVRALPRGRRARRDGAVLPAPRADLRACLLVQLPEYVPPEEIFREYAYFSSYSDSLGRARRAIRRHDDRAARARTATASSSRWPATTATCSSTSSPAGSRSSGVEPAAQRRRGRARAGRPDARGVLRRDARRESRARRDGPADLIVAQQRLAHVPDLNDFIGRPRGPARAGRHGHDRVPAPRPPRRGQPVRHDLPRALLVLHAPHVVRGSSPRTACACSTSRSCRRTAARCACSRARGRPRGRRRRAVVERCSRARRRPGYDDASRATPAFAERVAATKRALLAFLDRRATRRAGRSRATARRARRNTLLNYCGIRTDLLDVHGRPQPVQARPVHARARASRSSRPSALAADAARRHPDPALEPARRDRRPARAPLRAWGARARRPDPELEVVE